MTTSNPTDVVVCPACGTKNRVRRDVPSGQFRCGSCHGPLRPSGWLDRAIEATPRLFLRACREFVEILLLAIPIWVAWDSSEHPNPQRGKNTAPSAIAALSSQPQPVQSLEDRENGVPSNQTLAELIAAQDRAKALHDATQKSRSAPPPFNAPEEAIPLSGEVATYPAYRNRAVAPFEINPSSAANYLVKLADASTGAPVQTIFVRSGSPVKVKVPLGTFTVKYAAGVKWYGYHYLFGPTTSYSKASKPFTFTSDATGYTGYTITLYNVRDGNLRTQLISPNEF